MKKLSKSLSKRVFAVLNKDANFRDAYQMVCNRSKTKPYLVGGKLYRTLIELIYDYPARSHSCDFDFATKEITKYRTKKRSKSIDKYGTLIKHKYAGDSVCMTTISGAAVDLINISDLAAVRAKEQPVSIQGYLGSVPLSIQALAMDVDKCEIFGKIGLDSINEKYVWVNNESVLKEYTKYKGGTVDSYIKNKATSIRFGYHIKTKKRHPHLKNISHLSTKQYTALNSYFRNLTDTQSSYLNNIINSYIDIKIGVIQEELYCTISGVTYMFDGSIFKIIHTV